jgi:hypothetical protein
MSTAHSIQEINKPRHAVCCKVLNLLLQVGLASSVSPWLKPIAFDSEERDPF